MSTGTSTGTSLALNANWLSTTTDAYQTSNNISYGGDFPSVNGWWWAGYYYPYITQYFGHPTPAKIRLTLSEVERLRAAAKKDKALKATLQKFTPHIEIEVDF